MVRTEEVVWMNYNSPSKYQLAAYDGHFEIVKYMCENYVWTNLYAIYVMTKVYPKFLVFKLK